MAATDAAIEFERSREDQAWARWLARAIDAVLLTPAVYAFFFGVGIAVQLGQLPAEVFTWLETPALSTAIELLARFLMLCLWEPLFLANTGTTPGKWLMGIRVRTADGKHLGVFAALWRFVQVWLLGIGAGIPLVSLITMLTSRAKLISDGFTAWDEKQRYQVLHRKRHPALWTLLIALVVGVNIALAVLIRMGEQGF